ncbi:response regulator receiver domain-containing protein [Novosphingobium sp. PhB165]|uniref:response regulator n=1 Tax=Novosphingobium sp. PhB165 TaxID=2485105 RepID=UPI0010D45181|nr:response regulator [Novosphingobium sp. PhB165]TCM20630.1 response regulator receiver domain-containing protein [Novosphingobium sp. PhB165]
MSEHAASAHPADFHGLRVLVAEDELLVSMLLEDMLDDLGCHVIGPYAALSPALEAARAGAFDVAVIDMNLAGERSDPLLAELAERRIPVAIASGAGPSDLPGQPTTVLSKPYSFDQLADAVRTLHDARSLDRPGNA